MIEESTLKLLMRAPQSQREPTRLPAGSTRLSRPNETCAEPLSLAIEQFLEMVRFEQRARLTELPEELVRGQNVFL